METSNRVNDSASRELPVSLVCVAGGQCSSRLSARSCERVDLSPFLMFVFVLVQFVISRVAADEVMTGEIYSLSFGGWVSESLCVASCAASSVSAVLIVDIEMCFYVEFHLLHQLWALE